MLRTNVAHALPELDRHFIREINDKGENIIVPRDTADVVGSAISIFKKKKKDLDKKIEDLGIILHRPLQELLDSEISHLTTLKSLQYKLVSARNRSFNLPLKEELVTQLNDYILQVESYISAGEVILQAIKSALFYYDRPSGHASDLRPSALENSHNLMAALDVISRTIYEQRSILVGGAIFNANKNRELEKKLSLEIYNGDEKALDTNIAGIFQRPSRYELLFKAISKGVFLQQYGELHNSDPALEKRANILILYLRIVGIQSNSLEDEFVRWFKQGEEDFLRTERVFVRIINLAKNCNDRLPVNHLTKVTVTDIDEFDRLIALTNRIKAMERAEAKYNARRGPSRSDNADDAHVLRGANPNIAGYDIDMKQLYLDARAGNTEAQNQLGMCLEYGLHGMAIDDFAAVAWYKKASDNGYPAAKVNLARCHTYPIGKGFIMRCLETATILYEEATAARDPHAEFMRGYYHEKGGQGLGGVIFERNLGEAIRWYSRAAESFHIEAMYRLGKLYADNEALGIGYIGANRVIVQLYNEAAARGHAGAQYELGLLFENDGYHAEKARDFDQATRNFEKAFRCYEQSAEQKNPMALFRLGLFYEKRRVIVGEDVKGANEAIRCYEEAAKQGLADAQYNFGRCLENGIGTEASQKFPNRAVEQYKKAAEQKQLDAYYHLGRCYEYGIGGLPVDKKQAVEWYTLANKGEHAEAMYHLGRCYEHDIGTNGKRDLVLAQYRKAAGKEQRDALYRLGWCYEMGMYGLERNLENLKEAARLYDLAHQRGQRDAKYYLARLYEHGRNVFIVNPASRVRAFQLYTEAAAEPQPQVDALFHLGRCYEDGVGTPKSGDEALRCYRRAAELGNSDAHYKVAHWHRQGGRVVDMVRSFEAASRGEGQYAGPAAYELGRHLAANGQPEKAFRSYFLAAGKRHLSAIWEVTKCYEYGAGVDRDLAQTRKWLNELSGMGDLDAKFKLADFCERGLGGEKNKAEAEKLRKEAMDASHVPALLFGAKKALKKGDKEQARRLAEHAVSVASVRDRADAFELRNSLDAASCNCIIM